jgi:response regulator RpfG family c-di-GMP phosphodiesterase
LLWVSLFPSQFSEEFRVPNTGSVSKDAVSALLVGDFGEDRLVVHDVFRKKGWRLFEAPARRAAMQCLERNRVHVVVAGTDLPSWHWKRALADLRRLTSPPQLVVASRIADDQLWSEVLNLGAYDLLACPMRRDEVERVLVSARRHCESKPMSAQRSLSARAESAAA